MAEVGPDPGAGFQKPWSGGGREELAAAVRRLMTLTVAASASPEVLRSAAERLAELADELERHVHDTASTPFARFSDTSVTSEDVNTLAGAMPFDMIIGTCNPVAPPIEIEFEPPKAIGRVTYDAQYEGAPGCVHGAALAGAFDIMLTAANIVGGAAGPTVELKIRYRKPTLISQPALFEAWATGRKGRRIYSEGRLVQNGVVTVEATGEYVDMERSRIAAMHRRDDPPQDPVSD